MEEIGEAESKLAKLSESTLTLQEKALQGQQLCELSIKHLPAVTKILVSSFRQNLYVQQLSSHSKTDDPTPPTFETVSNLQSILNLVIDEFIQQDECIDEAYLDFIHFAVGNYRVVDEQNNVAQSKQSTIHYMRDPAGHKLSYYKDSRDRYLTGFKCDICGRTYISSIAAYACIPCRYDVCLGCHYKNFGSSLDVGFLSGGEGIIQERGEGANKVEFSEWTSTESAVWRPVRFPIEFKEEDSRKTSFLNKLWEVTTTIKEENELNKYISIIWATLIDDSLRRESTEIGTSKNGIILLLHWIETSSNVNLLVNCCGALASAVNNMDTTILSAELNLHIKNVMIKTIEKFGKNDNLMENIFQVLFNISTSRELLLENTVCALKARMIA